MKKERVTTSPEEIVLHDGAFEELSTEKLSILINGCGWDGGYAEAVGYLIGSNIFGWYPDKDRVLLVQEDLDLLCRVVWRAGGGRPLDCPDYADAFYGRCRDLPCIRILMMQATEGAPSKHG